MTRLGPEFFKKKCMGLLHDPVAKTLYHFFDNEKNRLEELEELKNKYGNLYEWTLNRFLSKIGENRWYNIKSNIDQKISDNYRFFKHLTDEKRKYYGDFKKGNYFVFGFYNIFSDTLVVENLDEAAKFIKSEKDFYDKNVFSKIPYSDNEEDWRNFYLYLWTVLDLFYLANTKIPIPEDTRSPVTDIIDHLYAWASMFNIEQGGYYVLIDFAGIQSFLEKSRKVSDLWSSSWLISMFAWKVVEPFLIYYGPDVLIKPTARTNPMWLLTLFNYFKKKEEFEYIGIIYKYLESWLGSSVKKIIKYDDKNDDIIVGKILTRTALIPASLTLIIPRIDQHDAEQIINIFYGNENNDFVCDKNDPEEILNQLFDHMIRELWNNFVQKIVEVTIKSEKVTFDSDNSSDTYFKLFNENIIKNIIANQVSKKPPFAIRVIAEKINDYKELLDKLGTSLEIEKNLEKNTIYLRLNKRLIEESQAVTKYNPYFFEPTIEGKPVTDLIYNDKSVKTPGFRFCSVCGLNPAIVESEMVSIKSDEDNNLKTLFFKKNEKLCPYCLIKRLFVLGLIDINKDILNLFFGSAMVNIDYFSIPKTVVSYALAEVVNLVLELKGNDIKKLSDVFGTNNLEKNKEQLFNYLKKRLLKEEIVRKLESDEEKLKLIYCMYKQFDNAEESMKKISFDKDKDISNELIAIKEYYNNPVFAYGYADNDYMGAIFEKRYDTAFRVKKENVKDLENRKIKLEDSIVLENLLKLIDNGYNLNDENINLVYSIGRNGTELFFEEVKEIIMEKKDFWKKFSIEEWMEISRAIVINTIKELITIDEKDLNAHIIYAGGDDLVFVCSRNDLMKLVEITRKIYSQGLYDGEGGQLGFYTFNKKSNVPTLGMAGRSYSIVLSHPKNPLFSVINTARNQEKKLKKGKAFAIVLNEEIKVKRKDVMILSYLTRSGSCKFSVLPFRLLDSLDDEQEAIRYSFDIPEKTINFFKKYFKYYRQSNTEKEDEDPFFTKTSAHKLLSNEIYRDIIKTACFEKKERVLTNFLKSKLMNAKNEKRCEKLEKIFENDIKLDTFDKYLKNPKNNLPINIFLVNYSDKKKISRDDIKNGSPLIMEMLKLFVIFSLARIYYIDNGDRNDN